MPPRRPCPRDRRSEDSPAVSPSRLTVAALVAAWSFQAGGPSTRAAVPLPAFPECGADGTFAGCPGDLDEWYHASFVPAPADASVRPEELAIGSGNGLDAAVRLTTGRWDAAIAVLDSGIQWDSGELAYKVQLNAGELPPPLDESGAGFPDPYDADGNGLLNVADYARDPRVDAAMGDTRAQHLLDPSDLIASFSDGVDDDGNGYVDDIAGWDFFSDDNDPGADNWRFYGDHGTGTMEEAGAEGRLPEGDPNPWNGGRIGTCPSCAVIPIRVGDSFISVGSRIAEGVAFAVDHGAASIAMALGGMTHTPMVEDALAYAFERGVVPVGAAGDETSLHHNFPSFDPHVLYVHSIGPDLSDWERASTFLRFVNCNNYGARLDLVAGSNACATGAVAIIAGGAALLVSRAREVGLDPPIGADEVGALLRVTADDVDVWESRGEDADPLLYPSEPGWDPYFGWGRVDLGAAATRITPGGEALPPAVQLSAPRWFEFVDPARVPELDVVGTVTGRNGPVAYTVEYGPGAGPADDAWIEVARGESPGQGGQEELLATWEVAGIPPSVYAPEARPAELLAESTLTDRAAGLDGVQVTLRIRMEDALGNRSEARRTVVLHHDPDLLSGFPVALGTSSESSPHLYDLDGDLDTEIVLATSDGRLHAFTAGGVELPGFPVTVGPLPSLDPAAQDHHRGAPAYTSGAVDPDSPQDLISTVAVADVDGDGAPEIAVATLSGFLHLFGAGGEERPGFPVEMARDRCGQEVLADDATWDCGFFASPVLADLDGDGDLEIVQAAMDQRVYVFRADGATQPGWPVDVNQLQEVDGEGNVVDREGRRIVSTPAVGDIDGDGVPEIVVGTNQVVGGEFTGYGVLYAMDARGEAAPGGPFVWPSPTPVLGLFSGALPYVGEGVPSSPVLADLDGDGAAEIGVAAVADTGRIFRGDGSEYVALDATATAFGPGSNVDEPSVLLLISDPVFADLTGDGQPDYLAPTSGIGYGLNLAAWSQRYEHQHALAAYDGHTFAALPGFPRQMEDMQFFSNPAVADVSGDGRPEAVHGSGGFLLHAWDADGVEPAGWPKVHGGWSLSSPAVGDVDGDGWLDVVATTREGHLFAWRTAGRADQEIGWAGFHHDPANTGDARTPLAPLPGPDEEPEGDDDGGGDPGPEEECGCAAEGAGSAGLWGLVVVGVAARKRRGGGARPLLHLLSSGITTQRMT